MSSIEMSAITFVLVFGGALLGLFIRRRLPEHHQNADTKDVVRLGMGLVGTIVAIALGLLIGSAYSYFNNQTNEWYMHRPTWRSWADSCDTTGRRQTGPMKHCEWALSVFW